MIAGFAGKELQAKRELRDKDSTGFLPRTRWPTPFINAHNSRPFRVSFHPTLFHADVQGAKRAKKLLLGLTFVISGEMSRKSRARLRERTHPPGR
jgi:hypothetical protein